MPLSFYVREDRDVSAISIDIEKVVEGMVLAEDVKQANGTLLISKGQKMSLSAIRLLLKYYEDGSIPGELKIVGQQQPCPVG